MYKSQLGKWAYQAGTNGTVTLPKGAVLLSVYAESHDPAGSIVIFGGPTIIVDGGAAAGQHLLWHKTFMHALAVAPSATPTIVFTNTVSYFVEYAGPGNP